MSTKYYEEISRTQFVTTYHEVKPEEAHRVFYSEQEIYDMHGSISGRCDASDIKGVAHYKTYDVLHVVQLDQVAAFIREKLKDPKCKNVQLSEFDEGQAHFENVLGKRILKSVPHLFEGINYSTSVKTPGFFRAKIGKPKNIVNGVELNRAKTRLCNIGLWLVNEVFNIKIAQKSNSSIMKHNSVVFMKKVGVKLTDVFESKECSHYDHEANMYVHTTVSMSVLERALKKSNIPKEAQQDAREKLTAWWDSCVETQRKSVEQ